MHPRYGRRLSLSLDQGLLLATSSWLLPTLTILVSMLVHLYNGARAVPFFISEADYAGLEGHVFTVGLTVAGFVQMTYAWHLYHSLEVEHEGLWVLATVFGLVASANTVLVSQYDMYGFINPHIASAMLAFGGGVVWAYLAQRALGNYASIRGASIRRRGFLMAFWGFVIMVISFEFAVSSFDPTGMTTEAFLNEAQRGIRIAAPAEYVLVGGLMVCLASFRHELMEQASQGASRTNEAS